MNAKNVRTAIKWAAVIFTAPATFEVAGGLYPAWAWYTRLPIQLAGLVLIEGALLLGWSQLDHNDKAEPAERWLYTGITALAYVALLYISVLHEGWQGWIFRLTLAAVIGYSVLESGILASLADKRRADRNVDGSRQVKRERRKLERETRKLELQSEHGLQRLEVQLREEARADELRKRYERVSRKAQQEHRQELRVLEGGESPQGTRGTLLRGNPPYSVERLNAEKRLTREQRLEQLLEFASSNPELQPSEVVEWAQRELGVAESTAWSYWSELKPELGLEGTGEFPSAPASNGNGHK